MVKPAGGTRLHVQPVNESVIIGRVDADEDRFDSDDAIDDRVSRFVDHAHSAASECCEDLVFADLRGLIVSGHWGQAMLPRF